MRMEIYVQRDAPEIIRNKLRPLFPDVRFLSKTKPTLDPFTETYVTVKNAGTPRHQRAVSSENILVTVYAGYEPVARKLAAQIDALLLNPTLAWGFSISPGPGLSVVADEDTGGYVASVTVVAGAPKEGVVL